MQKNVLNIALTPLTATQIFQYGTWDIEARNWWELLCIGVYDGKQYYHFRSVPDFINHILRREYRYYRWFAHFGGRYDLNFVFDWLRKERPDIACQFYCSGSMVLQMTLRRGDRLAKLCDSYRLLQASLRDLCKAFGVQHQKGEIDFDAMEYNKTLLEYNEADCIGLYEVLERFFEETGIRSETFATHALRVFRKEFLQERIWKPHPEICDFARHSYHGGHVEVFKRSGKVTAYDVNSMYPYVMKQPMPTEYIGESRSMKSYYGFIDCEIHIPDMYIPPLPVRMEKLFFPTGRIRGVWTTEELEEAELRGVRILKVFKGYFFNCREIFAGYVDTLYALKKKSGEPTRTIAKLLLNSLYGKFGQQPVKRMYVTEFNAPDGAYPILCPDGQPSGFAYYERASNSAYLLPHLASAVTSKARLVLLNKLNDASYYCDTDSVFTSSSIPIGNELGDWSLVGSGECTFIQPKLYRFNGIWKAKGLNKTQSIDDYVHGSINNVIRRRSIKESLADGQPACGDVEINKVLRETRPKRAWCGDDTRPWDVKELMK